MIQGLLPLRAFQVFGDRFFSQKKPVRRNSDPRSRATGVIPVSGVDRSQQGRGTQAASGARF